MKFHSWHFLCRKTRWECWHLPSSFTFNMESVSNITSLMTTQTCFSATVYHCIIGFLSNASDTVYHRGLLLIANCTFFHKSLASTKNFVFYIPKCLSQIKYWMKCSIYQSRHRMNSGELQLNEIWEVFNKHVSPVHTLVWTLLQTVNSYVPAHIFYILESLTLHDTVKYVHTFRTAYHALML